MIGATTLFFVALHLAGPAFADTSGGGTEATVVVPAETGVTGTSGKKETANKSPQRELAQKIMAAYGGEAKLRELESMAFRGKGKINEYSSISKAENSFDCTMVSMGNKLRIEMNIMGQPLITGYDGKTGWLRQGDQIFPADPAMLERIEAEIKHSLEHELLDLIDPDTKLSAKPDQTVNGHLCQGLSVQPKHDPAFTMYTDAQTHLILRTEFQGVDTEQGISAQIANDYLDYRPLLGSYEPFQIIEYTNGQKTTEAVQDTAELDKSVDDSFFEMPASHAIARLQQGPVEIPFEYAYNQIMIKAKANDSKDLIFIVDTGASQSMLDDKVAETIGPLEKSHYKVTTGGGSMEMNYIILKKLELGDLPLENVAVGCTDGSAFTQMRGSRPSGLLGANILKRFLVTFDFGERKIILADPDNVKIPVGAHEIATKPAMGNLGVIIEGVIDGKLTVPFLVDTGAAFDNLSATLVEPLVNEKLLPVSKILGLDGEQVSVGAVQFHTLKLGDFVIDNPVFSVASAPVGSSGFGMITSRTLGILGNPLWSRFKLTVDYRHNRIFLEKSLQETALESVTQQLDKIRIQLHQDHQYKKAHESYVKLLQSDDVKQFTSAQALIHADSGAATVEEAKAKMDKELMLSAKTDFDQANELAQKCKNTTVVARVFATLARHLAEVDPALLPLAKSMINRSVALAPMDAEVLTSVALLMKSTSPTLAQKVADQALSADPANWDALWFRYKLSQELNEPKDLALVEAQLRRYYPTAPEVVALSHAETVKHVAPKQRQKSY